ncbi:tol-pal system protein YbgF [Pelomonas aquatica]|jgi:tol-pal system protein YbgF|uniref:Cell division coordinator CpoB n=1 Tax=Pelomonas aquatica TaxID=431058 RepID=A0A9X4LI96_9BURK|nr:tol-pal system protein YbgF [Pelomonas aquatica]MCY4756137.1 tol-pal system protein YbgF [Pelomonas aquatica]MDG0863421.1 tol-pal system protein YbgF [Pelomonas aquatica]
MRALRLALVACAVGAAFVQPARAGLFEDDEARKAILELRGKVQANEDLANKRADQLNSLVQDQIQPLRRSVLDLNAQIDALRAEIAKLRGANEQLARDLADTQRKLTDQSQSVDARLKPLEPQKVNLDGREFQVSPDERSQYEAAIGLVRRGDFAEAVAALNAFLKRYTASGYTDSVRFWLGNAQYGKRDYRDAIATFKAFIAGNPDHPRAGEALLALANCQIELKDNKSARRSLEDLIRAYPGTEAAQAGKERLAALK